MKSKLFIIIIFLLNINLLANWKEQRENLDKRYIFDEFRIFYTLKGKNALQDKTDINKNKIPDIIENTVIQIQIAKDILENSFGLTNPLETKRYKNKLKHIDFHFLQSKYSGDSGDAIIKYNYKHFKEQNESSISITLSNKLKSKGLTPAHELFHSYQNAYTYFKNRWYTEGTARWFEYVFHEKTGKEKLLPKSPKEINELLNMTYDAKFFWNRIFHLCNKMGVSFPISKKVKNLKYIGESESVISKNDIYGYKFMKLLLENFSIYDKISYNKRKLIVWKEKEQKSFENNNYILEAIIKTIEQSSCKNKEVLNLKKEISKFIKLNQNKTNEIDYSKHLLDLNIPLIKHYDKDTDLYARNPWDLNIYKNRLYIAAGNTNNIGPSKNAGPVPIVSMDLNNNSLLYEGKVEDEQIERFDIFNNKLYIAGADAIEDHKFGNLYTKINNNWIKKRTIPNAYHVFALENYNDKLFAAISTAKGAEVAWSTNDGNSWAVQQLGLYQSSYNFIKLNGNLYVAKQFLPKKRKDKLKGFQLKNYHAIAQFDNGIFIPRKDITTNNLFPDTKLNLKRHIKVIKSMSNENNSLIIAGYTKKEPFGIYSIKSLKKGNIISKKINLDPRLIPTDISITKDYYLVLGYIRKGKSFSNYLIKVKKDNPKISKTLIHFKYPSFARSFEESNKSFYFGMGSEIKNSKKWKQKELHKTTGKILKIDKKNLF